MKVIVGLGNPGSKYKQTRHNVGFLVLDELQKKIGAHKFQEQLKFKAFVANGIINGEKMLLVKPQTFMNLSGESVQLILNFYKIEVEDLIVIHDDVDLPLGQVKIKTESSAGGHNGIKSIIKSLNSKNFIRVKLGIENRADQRFDTADFVLGRFSENEQVLVEEMSEKALLAIFMLFEKGLEKTMSVINRKD